MTTVRLVVLGALGRMGRAILDAIANDSAFHLQGAVVKEQSHAGRTLGDHGLKQFGQMPVQTSPIRVDKGRVVVIDVTQAESVAANLRWAAKAGHPYVLAVTGLGKSAQTELKRAAKKIPIVLAPNLSMGVAVLREVAWIAAALLPDSEVEIVETHHRQKKDAPSGTALSLAESVMQATKRKGKISVGRTAQGRSNPEGVTIHSLRGGDVVGEHRVHLLMDGERLELGHVATSRAIFARGALKAARFLVGKKPGLYTMLDVLGLGKGGV